MKQHPTIKLKSKPPNVTDLLRELAQLTLRISTLELYVLDAKTAISELAEREAEVTAQLKELAV